MDNSNYDLIMVKPVNKSLSINTFLYAFIGACSLLSLITFISVISNSGPGSITGVEDLAITSSVQSLFIGNIAVLVMNTALGIFGLFAFSSNSSTLKNVFFLCVFLIFGRQLILLSLNANTLVSLYNISPQLLTLTILPHALIELTAMFLPLSFLALVQKNKINLPNHYKSFLIIFGLGAVMILWAAFIEHYAWTAIINHIVNNNIWK